MRYPRFAADPPSVVPPVYRVRVARPSGSRERERRSATVVARALVEFQIDRPFVERLGARLFGACRRSARPCAAAAAVPDTVDPRVVVIGRKGAVERCRETGGAERHAIGEPRVDVRASARSGGGARGSPRASSPSSRGRRFRYRERRNAASGSPGARTTAGSAAGRSDAVRLPVRGILRGVWALRGKPRARLASTPVRRSARVARWRSSWFTREEVARLRAA